LSYFAAVTEELISAIEQILKHCNPNCFSDETLFSKKDLPEHPGKQG